MQGAERQTCLIARFHAVLCAAGLALTCAGTAVPEQDSAKEAAMALARQAKRADKAGKGSEAYLLYSQAAARQPRDKKYQLLMEAAKGRAEREAQAANHKADAKEQQGALYEKTGPPVFDSMTAREAAAGRQLLEPPALRAKEGRNDFDITGSARTLFDAVAKRFELETIYTEGFPDPGPPVHFKVSGVDYREALHDLEAATGALVVPVSTRLFMVAQDTPSNRNDLEQSISVSIPVPQAVTQQELTEIAQAVRQATNIEKLAWSTGRGELTLRDRISRVLPAQALLQELLGFRGEVMLDVEFIEISDSDVRNFGFKVTNSFQALYLGQILHNAITAPAGVANLLTLGGGKTLIGLGVAQVQAILTQTSSTSRTLFRAQIRTTDGQPGTFHAGEKYPIVTAGFYGAAAGAQGQTFAPPPSITYEELGVSVKVTPRIHDQGEITLAVDTTFELLSGTAVNGIPVIGRRQLVTQARLRDGEAAIVAGLIGKTDAKSVAGFWGLAQIPLLGNLFKQTSLDKEDSSVLVVITPHVLSLPRDQASVRSLRTGSDTRPYNPL